MLILKEKVHSSGDQFGCGVGRCPQVFHTGVGYIYHLNKDHGYMIDSESKARHFLLQLHDRLDEGAHERGLKKKRPRRIDF